MKVINCFTPSYKHWTQEKLPQHECAAPAPYSSTLSKIIFLVLTQTQTRCTKVAQQQTRQLTANPQVQSSTRNFAEESVVKNLLATPTNADKRLGLRFCNDAFHSIPCHSHHPPFTASCSYKITQAERLSDQWWSAKRYSVRKGFVTKSQLWSCYKHLKLHSHAIRGADLFILLSYYVYVKTCLCLYYSLLRSLGEKTKSASTTHVKKF